jgi:hypothetical protein
MKSSTGTKERTKIKVITSNSEAIVRYQFSVHGEHVSEYRGAFPFFVRPRDA